MDSYWIPLATRFSIPANEFWSMRPKTIIRRQSFYEAQLKTYRQNVQEEAWIYGVYVGRALGTLFKGSYPEQPLDFYGLDKKYGNKKEEEESNKTVDFDMFSAYVIAYNKQKFPSSDESEVSEDA